MERVAFESTQQGDLIETLICKPITENGKTDKMSDTASRVMISVAMDREGAGEIDTKLANHGLIAVLIFKDRLEGLGYTVADGIPSIIGVVGETPGAAVLYANVIAYLAKRDGIKHIDLEALCVKWFPWGFFTRETVNEYWDKQKVARPNDGTLKPDNLLDYKSAAQSLILKAQTDEEI